MIARMSDHGAAGGASTGVRRSRIADYAESTTPPEPVPTPLDGVATSPISGEVPADEASLVRRRRREGAALLGEFRRTAVLLPLGDEDAPLTADFGGIRWIYAFSDEPALARFAIARGEGAREWSYERILGARLLDVAIPAMPVPYGVALDVGSEGEGALFPPVRGIVPDAAALDLSGVPDVPGVPDLPVAPGMETTNESGGPAR